MMCAGGGKKAKICPVSLGIAVGVTKGLYLMLLAWVAMFFGYGTAMVDHISSVYPSYVASFSGGLIGGLWGLICGFVFGFVVAFLYDWCVCCRSKSDSEE
jgi:hypothetical protein